MNKNIFFILIMILGLNAYGQFESNTKFKIIKPQTTTAKPKKELPPPSSLPKLDIPKIVAPNIFKETNIFGTKPRINNSFQIGIPENNFSMTLKNKFDHKSGDVFQNKMIKDLDRTMIKEELKEDKSLLDRNDNYLGDFRTKSDFFDVKYRDYIEIDGDLINVYLNDKLLKSELYLNYDFGKFRIPLVIGLNTIELVVASTGTSGGNTAEIHVFDNVNRPITSEYWNNKALGVKIKMIVIRLE